MVPGISRLIVGTSGSPGSLRALRYGEFLARAHHAFLVPVIAWEPPGGERAERIQPSGPLREEVRDLACQRLRMRLSRCGGRSPRTRWWSPTLSGAQPGGCWSAWPANPRMCCSWGLAAAAPRAG